MSTKGHSIVVGGIPVEVVRKSIKNLHLGVYPPNGRVRVAAPFHLSDNAIRLALVSRLGWIHRKRVGFERQDRQSEREMVTGETHFVEGMPYRLNIVEVDGLESIRTRPNRRLEIRIRPDSTGEHRVKLLNDWYRERLREQVGVLVAKWQPHIEVEVAQWSIRKMKTKWGSCNIRARRIWINSELAKKPFACLEFIVVHELVHLLERRHNERFREQMNRLLPNWNQSRAQLNRAPLSYENWSY